MGLTTSQNKPITLNSELTDNSIYVLDGDLYNVGAYQSRSLFVTRDKSHKIEEKDKIKVYFDSGEDLQTIELDIPLLLSDYSEYRKLIIYDSKHRYSDLKILFKYFDETYFVAIDINDYPINDIQSLLELVISHYRKNNDIYQIVDYNDVLAQEK